MIAVLFVRFERRLCFPQCLVRFRQEFLEQLWAPGTRDSHKIRYHIVMRFSGLVQLLEKGGSQWAHTTSKHSFNSEVIENLGLGVLKLLERQEKQRMVNERLL